MLHPPSGKSAIPDAPPAAPSASSDQRQPPRGTSSRARWKLLIAAGLAIAWVTALAVLTYRTANPVTLNFAQIRTSRQVVTARVVDAATGQCQVERLWFPGPPLTEITVEGLADCGAISGETYLLALTSRGRRGYEVTPLPRQNQNCLIYPATPDAETQLQAILASLEEEPPQ